jgi:hypothetical protein
MQSGNLTDSGLSKTGIISPLGVPVYLTFEASRGNSSNSFQISASDCYDDDPFKVDESLAPLGDTSYKISQPGSPKPAAFVSGITMMVRPNPFRTQTEIELDVPSEVLLNVTVFDLLGKHITTLYNNYSVSIHHDFILDSKQLTPGMYLSGFKQVIRLFRGRLNW